MATRDFVGVGDFTKERHEGPQRPMDEIWADIARLEAEYPETLTVKPVAHTVSIHGETNQH